MRGLLHCALPLIAFSAAALGETAPDTAHSFVIAAGTLTGAIQALSQQGDVQIITAVNTTRLKSPPVRGTMRTDEALALLLKGLPVRAEYLAGGYILKHASPEAVLPKQAEIPPEEIVITGYRGSLQRAIDLKYAAVVSQDSIVAEDIAAFPDINLAESLQRIPGVAITRDSGEGRQITVRSLGPDFTRTQLNGMEVLGNTASGMDNRGLVSRTRAFDFSLFASELFSAVSVVKSYATDEDEGGIAGTVKLSTARPFDFSGFKAALSAKAMSNSGDQAATPHVAGLISNRWGDFGALLAVAFSTANSVEYGYRNWGWHQVAMGAANIGPGVSSVDTQALLASQPFMPIAETYSSWFDHRVRIGVSTSLEYRPGDHFELVLDTLYGHLSNHRSDYALAAAGSNGLTSDITGTQRLEAVSIAGNSVVAAQFSHVDLRSESNQMRDATDFYQSVLNGRAVLSQSLTITGLIGISRSAYGLPVFDKVFLESQDRSFSFNYTSANHPVNTYGGDLTDPAQWNLMRLDTQEQAITSQYINAKLGLEWRPQDGSWLSAGLAYKRFRNSGWSRADKEFHNDPTDEIIPLADKVVFSGNTLAPYVVGDVGRTYATIGQTRDLNPSYNVPGSDYRISEDSLAAFLQYNVDGAVLGHALRANFGLRSFTTWLTSSGTLNNGTSLAPVSVSYRYGDVLPAANVVIGVADNILWRFSANRNISRPALSDLAAAGTLSTAPFGGSLTIGNPNLRPFRADAVETSLEYYDEGASYMSVGVFYKNMEKVITTATTLMPYSQTGYPLSFLLPHQDPNVPYNVTTPVNAKGASFLGLEAALQRDFKFLPAPFDQFGVIANLTYADGNSAVIFNGQSVSLPLPNLSKLSFNATLYYESNDWSIRVSEAYRGKYCDGAGTYGNIGGFFEATSNVDFAVHYRLSDHLKATVEGINMTDQPIIQYTDVTAKRIEVVTRSGHTVTFGAAYEF
ncbi:MAG: TonB-dependent receptor [Rhizomicrobium sp.]|nr:TonB-dependent receptor [Rhizomicrobium sp.]